LASIAGSSASASASPASTPTEPMTKAAHGRDAAARRVPPSAARAARFGAAGRVGRSSGIDIAHLPFRAHGPALDRVIVVAIARSALGEQRRARRLHGAGLVDR